MIKFARFTGILLGLLTCGQAHGDTFKSKEAGVHITTNKVAHLIGSVDDVNAAKFVLEMTATMNLPGDRVIIIDSHGGRQDAGDLMIARIELEKKSGVRIVCVGMGWIESMAFNLFTHCDVRLAERQAVLLFHELAHMEWPSDKRMTPYNLRESAKWLERDDIPYRDANAKALRMNLIDYALFARNDREWRAPDLLLRGYLHGILDK